MRIATRCCRWRNCWRPWGSMFGRDCCQSSQLKTEPLSPRSLISNCLVVPVVAVRRQHPAELELEPLAGADVQVPVEQIPLPVDAPLQRHLVLEQPGQAAFQVDPDPGDVDPAACRALVVG